MIKVEPDVRSIAQGFNLDASLVQAICNAEGNIVAAVRCTYPEVSTREDAIRILCRSIVHAMRDYIVARGHADDFIARFGARWAPLGATNDPTRLNANWVTNVRQLWGVA